MEAPELTPWAAGNLPLTHLAAPPSSLRFLRPAAPDAYDMIVGADVLVFPVAHAPATILSTASSTVPGPTTAVLTAIHLAAAELPSSLLFPSLSPAVHVATNLPVTRLPVSLPAGSRHLRPSLHYHAREYSPRKLRRLLHVREWWRESPAAPSSRRRGRLCSRRPLVGSVGQRYSKMYRLKRYRYTIFEKKLDTAIQFF